MLIYVIQKSLSDSMVIIVREKQKKNSHNKDKCGNLLQYLDVIPGNTHMYLMYLRLVLYSTSQLFYWWEICLHSFPELFGKLYIALPYTVEINPEYTGPALSLLIATTGKWSHLKCRRKHQVTEHLKILGRKKKVIPAYIINSDT